MQSYLRYVQCMHLFSTHCVHGMMLYVMRLNEPFGSFLRGAYNLVRKLYHQKINDDDAIETVTEVQGTSASLHVCL